MRKLKIEKRVRVLTGEFSGITLVGCGGTGSFLALHLARIAYHLQERGQRVRLAFVDMDRVEPQNIGRQNFAPAEIEQFKAQTLMLRFNRAFGLDIEAHNAPFGSYAHNFKRVELVIGAVDNAAARRSLAEVMAKNLGDSWWLDCGNHEHSGQVLFGNRPDLRKPEFKLGVCVGLPLPSVVHSELLESEPEEERSGESCAELAARDVQSLMVNQAAAGWAASYVYRLLVSRDLDVYATYFDLVAGSARSLAIVAR
ncbi:MAG: PRTRC system ThiF family protein [Anaerolineae bacterium]|nr:PRTRC system ThiF family protein [Anaerolineae bacterium]